MKNLLAIEDKEVDEAMNNEIEWAKKEIEV
jgi:hypothetical protein